MSKKNQKPVKDDIQLAQDILMDEVIEEVHNEQLRKVWDKYKYFLFFTVFCVVVAVSSWEVYQSWQMKNRIAESDVYEKAVILNAKGQVDEALSVYSSLENGKTNYRYLAQLRKAGLLFETGKNTEALAVLNALRQDENVPEPLRATAALGYVSHQLETEDVATLQEILNPYLTVGNVWYGTAVEMSIFLMIRDGQNEKATKMLDEALTMDSVSAVMKERLDIVKKMLDK
jgi:hypothetical protein